MTALEIEAKKAELARSILNIDSEIVLNEIADLLKKLTDKKPCMYSPEEIRAGADRVISAYMEIKSLREPGFDTIFEAFNQAFANYEIKIDSIQLQAMLKRRGFSPDLSFAAFDGDKIVAFTLNGIGGFNDIPTAYDTGTGTLKDYRGQGLATQVFEYSIPYLREAGIKQYLLEVLQHNTKAVSVYRNLGFEVSREFFYFAQNNDEIRNDIKSPDIPYEMKPINIAAYDEIPGFWDFPPSWQNGFESIKRSAADFISLGVFIESKLTGYCVFEPVSGDVTQLAVAKQSRRKGVASLLLGEMIKLNKNDMIKVVNTDISCHSITNFLKVKNIDIKGKQFEMLKKI